MKPFFKNADKRLWADEFMTVFFNFIEQHVLVLIGLVLSATSLFYCSAAAITGGFSENPGANTAFVSMFYTILAFISFLVTYYCVYLLSTSRK